MTAEEPVEGFNDAQQSVIEKIMPFYDDYMMCQIKIMQLRAAKKLDIHSQHQAGIFQQRREAIKQIENILFPDPK